MKVIVTTATNPIPALQRFAQLEDWILLIIGNTSCNEFKNINCVYLSPDDQKRKYPAVFKTMGEQRKNIGFIEAFRMGAEIIASVDEAHVSHENWGNDILIGKETSVDWWETLFAFDPLSVTKHNHIWHRGFPVQFVHNRNAQYLGKKTITPLIQANLLDIDTMEKIVWWGWRAKWRPMDFGHLAPYSTPNFTPFNSRNTFFSRKAFPHYCLLPFVGRMADIWGGYMMQKSIGTGNIVFNAPNINQESNEMNLIEDMNNEWIGLNTLDFLLDKYELPDDTKRFIDVYKDSF